MKRVFLMACCMASLLATSLVTTSALAADTTKAKVYTWTDDKGVIHYGERPPKDVNAKLVKTRTGHSDPAPAYIPSAPVQQEEQAAAPDEAQRAQNEENCELIRRNLTMLNSAARMKTPDGNGNLRYMTEEEKEQKRQEMQRLLEENCE